MSAREGKGRGIVEESDKRVQEMAVHNVSAYLTHQLSIPASLCC